MAAREYTQPKAFHVRLVASLAVVVMFAIVVPLSAGAAGPPMKQVKKYESPSSASAAAVAPFFCVGVGTTPCGTVGVTWGSLGRDPVSFRVSSRARSFMIAIVDDSGLPVRAFVSGDVAGMKPDAVRPWPNPVCGTAPVKMSLARGARVVHVWPDLGLWAVPERVRPEMPSGCLLSPLSIPTEGLITMVFGRRG